MVVAGGAGSRFGGQKQFVELGGMPLAARAVAAARSVADGVVLVVPATEAPEPGADPSVGTAGRAGGADAVRRPVAAGRPDRAAHGLHVAGDGPERAGCGSPDVVVPGGTTRAGSVRNGLAAVPATADVVVVHDAARPLAGPALFEAVVEAVRRPDGPAAAVPGLPVSDTVKRVDGARVVATVDRSDLVAVQTPQAFRADGLRRAHAGAGEATDDAALIESLGLAVVVVPGDPGNLKVTTPEDLVVAAALLERRAGAAVGPEAGR